MNNTELDTHLITLLDKNSIVAEQYRNIRAKILLTTESSNRKTILITSAVPQEGKTLTAANLAISLAQGVHERVLLIDGDLRQPTLHRLLNIHAPSGLGDYLIEDISLTDIIMPSPLEKLSVITAGKPVGNPSELLNSEKMSALITKLRAGYPNHFIIFDSPPLTPVSDSILLAKMLDWVIFVVLTGHTPRETITSAIASFEPSRILGLILNKLETLPQQYSYKYNYPSKPDKPEPKKL